MMIYIHKYRIFYYLHNLDIDRRKDHIHIVFLFFFFLISLLVVLFVFCKKLIGFFQMNHIQRNLSFEPRDVHGFYSSTFVLLILTIRYEVKNIDNEPLTNLSIDSL